MSTTTTWLDPWIERHIGADRLSPGARGMSRADAAAQYNSANALTPADEDYLYTPEQAQAAVREVLGAVGVHVDDGITVTLTDAAAGPWCRAYLVNPGQIGAGLEQLHLITGERLAAEAVLRQLPWH
ncbi:hypothetical protein IU436_30065 [Nocardia farcinica]|uniref:hypothetical protein n=1 Tax=Nocardia farcinica TaxID=37329 RepID=UPI0018954400|nr:hypothetical protein [Nocardia farcinica]MBF6271295.1 hypothetical protein [Nocardia farcinica]MBF6422836.1 hypothetical protein [Nocardia farcinica]MBF6434564.1 hypothetical protein [Nocardia farcinica]MBF6505655.1 hypothetical protein [Nocardia farcinica]